MGIVISRPTFARGMRGSDFHRGVRGNGDWQAYLRLHGREPVACLKFENKARLKVILWTLAGGYFRACLNLGRPDTVIPW